MLSFRIDIVKHTLFVFVTNYEKIKDIHRNKYYINKKYLQPNVYKKKYIIIIYISAYKILQNISQYLNN